MSRRLCHTQNTPPAFAQSSFTPFAPFVSRVAYRAYRADKLKQIERNYKKKKNVLFSLLGKQRFNFPYHLLCQERRAEVCSFIALGEKWLGPIQGINKSVFCPSMARKLKIYCCFLNSTSKTQIYLKYY